MAPKGKKVAPAPFGTKKAAAQTKNPLFEKRPRNFTIGNDVLPKKDLTRFVKWPEYVRLQRQRKILRLRLKVPPSINQFNQTLDKNTAANLFKFLNGYRPETKQEKKTRLAQAAETTVKTGEKPEATKPYLVKYGLNHITALVEAKKAKLVVIANDVDPIEVSIFCNYIISPYPLPLYQSLNDPILKKRNLSVVLST
jgi:large subunit ribosomal protein L7Ae